ncbi:MAG: ester cyclase [Deltaproteobacteria bacterium]|nr:ester cyclase [Deltaproteobacteria bacterium]
MATAEQNKAIFVRFLDELRKGNLAIIDEVCSSEFAFHSPNWPNWPRGIEGARKLATYGKQLYRDAHATIDDIIAEEDRVAVRWTITGTWIGHERPGSPQYGQPVAVGSMSWYRFVDGKIVEDWGTEVFWPTGTAEAEIVEWRSTR